MIAFSLGVFLGGLIPALPAARLIPLLLIPSVLRLRFPALHLVSAYCLGLFWLLNWGQHSMQQLLPRSMERTDFWVQGEIVSLPEEGDAGMQFVFRVSKSCQQPALEDCVFMPKLLQGQLIRLSLYQPLDVQATQHWQFRVRLKRPHGLQNPGGFDYEAWLWQQQIRGVGYVRDTADSLLLEEADEFAVQTFRQRFRDKLSAVALRHNLEHTSLVAALAIGDRQGLTTGDWDLFRATGTSHLVVISGMHVGLVAWLFYRAGTWILARIPGLALLLPAQRGAACIAILAALIYAALAGFALPAQRAFCMLLVFMAGLFLRRQHSAPDVFCLALVVVLLLNPLAPAGSGFWLSFIAVAVLLFCLRQRAEPAAGFRQELKLLLQAQCAIFLGLLPFLLLFFQQASLSAPLVNLLAVPWISLLVVPLCLLALLCSLVSDDLFGLLCSVLDILLDLLMSLLELVTRMWPHALVTLPALRVWQWVCLGVVLMLLLSCLRQQAFQRRRVLLALLLMPLLWPLRERPESGAFSLDVLDVGQGLAAVIQTRNHVLLYDLGPAYSDDFNAGAAVVLPFLRTRNITRPDRVIISHADNDHAGGLSAVFTAFPEAQYLSGEAEALGTEVQAGDCRSGQGWTWDGVRFELLHPDSGSYSANDASCVLRVSNARHRVLLTGDIEGRVERLLLQRSASLQAEVLIAPHHGSRTSSRADFVQQVDPDYVVFSAGYLNQFNHPHPDIVKLYTNSGTIALNTAETGAISWRFRAQQAAAFPELYRLHKRRFWRLPE